MKRREVEGIAVVAIIALLVLVSVWIGIEAVITQHLEPALDRWVVEETETWPVG